MGANHMVVDMKNVVSRSANGDALRTSVWHELSGLRAALKEVPMSDGKKALIEYHSAECMRLKYGQCSTRRCLIRGGWNKDATPYQKATYELPDFHDAATCEAYETVQALKELASLEDAKAKAEAKCDRLYEALHDALAEHAQDRCVDAPEWNDSDSVTISVTIGQLRNAVAALAKARGEALKDTQP